MKMTNPNGRFGIHGGQYIPETLMNAGILIDKTWGDFKGMLLHIVEV